MQRSSLPWAGSTFLEYRTLHTANSCHAGCQVSPAQLEKCGFVCLFYQNVFFQFLVFTSSVHVNFTHPGSCCWSRLSVGSQVAIVKALGCKSVVQTVLQTVGVPFSSTDSTKTGDFWSKLSSFSRKLSRSTTRVGITHLTYVQKSKWVAGRPI